MEEGKEPENPAPCEEEDLHEWIQDESALGRTDEEARPGSS